MIQKYQDLLEKLRDNRKVEEEILDEMDAVWNKLSEKEIGIINCNARKIYIKIVGKGYKNLFFVFDVDPDSDVWPQVKKCIKQSEQLTIKEAILCDDYTTYYGTVTK